MSKDKSKPSDSFVHISVHLEETQIEVLKGNTNSSSIIDNLIEMAVLPEHQRLEVVKEIARGGAGSIHLVKDHSLGRKMAAKVLHDQWAAQPTLVRGFLREAQVMAQLDHPHIAPVHELGIKDGRLFFTMGLIEGQSLEKWLDLEPLTNHGRVAEFLEIVSKVCDALDFAHSRGVLHCDLKPDNIMVGEYGRVYLMDWGGAQMVNINHDGTQETPKVVEDNLPELPRAQTVGKFFGTPSYCAPERVRGLQADQRSDIFSIGAIIYKFIKGKAPFAAADHLVSMELARSCNYEPINEDNYADLLPRGLFGIVKRAMAVNPDERYATVAELNEDLNNIIRGGGVFPAIKVKKDTHIIHEGDSGETAYVVASGTLEVYREIDGKHVTLRTLGKGDVFGEMAILAGAQRTANVIAQTDSVLIQITEDLMHRELDAMKPWMALFVRTLAKRFHERETKDLSSTTPSRS